jgi:hypothetical protein
MRGELQHYWQHSVPKQKKQYVSGETQFYLGRRYMLKILTNPELAATFKLSGG